MGTFKKTAAVLAVLFSALAAAQSPQKVAYQGLLLKADGTPETGVQTIRFSVHDAATGGSELWFEQQSIALTQGFYATTLGDTTAFPGSVFDGTERFLELSVGGTALTPRMRIVAVPYAIKAGSAATAASATNATNATNVTGGTVNATSISVNGTTVIDSTGALAGNTTYQGVNGVTVTGRNIGLRSTCNAGDMLRWDQTSSSWVCATYVAPSDGGVVAYSADPDGGLVLTGSNFTAFSLLRSCAANQVLKWNGNAWVCANDADTITTYGVATGQGLALTGAQNNLFGLGMCPSGQVLKSGGGTWACAPDTDTLYTATVNKGLLLTGTGFAIDACPSGQMMKSTGGGNWACASDIDTLYDVTASGGLLKSGNNFALGNCPSGQVMKSAGSGSWGCQPDNDSLGTVTSVTAGTGLLGGTISSTGTISLATTVPNWTYTGGTGPANCPAGQVLRVIAQDGTPTCVSITGGGTVTSITGSGGVITSPDAGITSTGTISLATTVQNWVGGQPSCPVGQAIQSIALNGTPNCVTVSLDGGGGGGGSVTSVGSGAGLTGGPITGSGTLSIATGGVTNAMLQNSGVTVTAGAGLTGGGAVALGGSTTLSLATPVGIANGGTGMVTAPTAGGQFLRSSVANAWSVGTIQASDLPNLNGTYVDLTNNQTINGVKTFNFTINGSISGNAGTVTAGLYSNQSYADPSWLTSLAGSKISGNISGTAAGFTGALAGDVTGTQGATNVVRLQGRAMDPVAPNANQVLAWNGTTWTPASVLATAPVAIAGNNISLNNCPAGQLYKSDGGTSWQCATDNDTNSGGTVTNVATGAGLTGGPITGTGTISIANAGVTNAMLANPSITVSAGSGLTGGGAVALGGSTTLSLATPVIPVNGGTGLTVGPSGAGQYLRSTGVGTWGMSTIQASDIPSLSSTYVDLTTNQTIGGTKTFSNPISGSITGNAATATTATNFSGALAGDVTGTQAATSVVGLRGRALTATVPAVNNVLTYTASGWSPAAVDLANTTGTLAVNRGGTGSTTQNFVDLTTNQAIGGTKTFSSPIAGSVTGSAASFTGALAGDVTGTQGATNVVRLQGRAMDPAAPNANQVLAWNGTTWTPASVLATAPVSITGNNISLNNCPAGQLYKSDGGTSWQCATDNDTNSGGTVTNVATGAGLTGGPITGTGTVSIATGGVTNAMLANPSITITGVNGLTGGGTVALGGSTSISLASPVATANGGTGLTTAPTMAGQFLKSSAIGVWSINTIDASDIATGSLSIARGGTGSSIQNFVDLSTNQNIAGTKTFTNPITGSVTGSAASFTGNLAGDVTGPQGTTFVARLRGLPIAVTPPANGQYLQYVSGAWTPSPLSEGDGVIGNEVIGNTDTTLIRAGAGTSASPYTLAINLGNTNTWLANQAFNAPTNFNAVTFLNAGAAVVGGQIIDMMGTSTIRFNSTTSTTAPMLQMFSTCCNNGIRPVIGHSPGNLDWGLAYDDNSDVFRFQASNGSVPVMHVDILNGRVAVAGSSFVGGERFNVNGATYLNGATTVNGAVTATAYDYSAAQTRYKFIPAGSMTVVSGDDQISNYASVGFYFTTCTGTCSLNLVADLDVPDNAVINRNTCWIYDNSAANDLSGQGSVSVIGKTALTSTNTLSASLATTGQSTLKQAPTFAGVLNVDAVNNHYGYFVSLTSSAAEGTNLRFYGCEVQYTVTSPD